MKYSIFKFTKENDLKGIFNIGYTTRAGEHVNPFTA